MLKLQGVAASPSFSEGEVTVVFLMGKFKWQE